jgi:hypothetical protein
VDTESRPLRNLETVRRTVWNPTLCKSGKGWGSHGIVS